MNGCVPSGFFDPSIAGRWEGKPGTVGIQTRIAEVEPAVVSDDEYSPILPEDNLVIPSPPAIGAGDRVLVSVFGLLETDRTWEQSIRIDDLGNIRIPVAGVFTCNGLTAYELEDQIRQRLLRLKQLNAPIVSVIITENLSRVFTILGDPDTIGTTGSLGKAGGSGVGSYAIPRPDFRLLDALAKASGVSGKVRRIYVIRPIMESAKSLPTTQPADQAIAASMPQSTQPSTQPAGVRRQRYRVIEVNYDQLLAGKMENNIVIRAGDIIRIPPVGLGSVFIGGEVSKPGMYPLNGEQEMTLKQLIFAAGGIGPLGIPEFVDLIRRTPDNKEGFVRVNMRAVFAGKEPDYFLKPNDVVNVGTTFMAFPLAALRNGLRTAYGFDAVQSVP